MYKYIRTHNEHTKLKTRPANHPTITLVRKTCYKRPANHPAITLVRNRFKTLIKLPRHYARAQTTLNNSQQPSSASHPYNQSNA